MSIIRNLREKIKPSAQEEIRFNQEGEVVPGRNWDRFFLALTIVLVSSLSFGIGRLSVVGKREGVKIEYDHTLSSTPTAQSASTQAKTPNTGIKPQTNQTASVISTTPNPDLQVVVSKNGTKYHYLHCSGAKQIKEENKITFASASLAEAAGYTLASNCKPR